MKKIQMNRINSLFAEMDRQYQLYLPGGMGKQVHYDVWGDDKKVLSDPADRVNYDRWSEDKLIRLDVLNTATSVKDLFFPQSEGLAHFKREGKQLSVEQRNPTQEKFVVFGVRPCDAKALDVLDRVFLSDPVDTYYKARRENGTVIVLTCSSPEETCFCPAFGIDATAPAGDVSCWVAGGFMYMQALSEKGETLMGILEDKMEHAEREELDEPIRRAKENLDNLPLGKLDLSRWGAGKTMALFDSPKWKQLSESCIGCGSCTFACPTCQCYDIRDFEANGRIYRSRCWDSCMYSDFTLMAHGNPRKTQMERFRQRFMHKLVYFPDNNDGMFSCVGCGRCLVKCPVSLNIVKVAESMGEDADE